ncbi:MAG: hypothetical protein J6B75_01400 [Ruminococcus sp.]|nr:hypothetical protein [Ruminococcus sp.]
MNEEIVNIIEENAVSEELHPEDSTENLREENFRRKKEGRLEDTAAVQAAVCLILSIGIVLLNVWKPDMAGDLFNMVKSLSVSEKPLFENPINTLIEFISELCRK